MMYTKTEKEKKYKRTNFRIKPNNLYIAEVDIHEKEDLGIPGGGLMMPVLLGELSSGTVA